MTANPESAHEKATTSESSTLEEHGDRPDQPVGQESKRNIVDWDGPNDAQNPMNWPPWKRMIQVILASSFLLTA